MSLEHIDISIEGESLPISIPPLKKVYTLFVLFYREATGKKSQIYFHISEVSSVPGARKWT